MKRLVALLSVACLLLSSVGVVSAAVTATNSSVALGNYLTNGTIEDASLQSVWTGATATTAGAYNGSYGLAASKGAKRAVQSITVPTGKTYIQSAYVRTQDTIISPNNTHYIGFYNESAIAGIQGKLYGPTHNWTQILWMYEVPASLGAEATINTGVFSNSPNFYVDDLYLGQVTAVLSDIRGESLIYIPETGSVTETYQTSYTNQVGTMDGLDSATFAWSLDKAYTGISINAQSGVMTVTNEATTQTVSVIATVTPNINDLAPITETKTVQVKTYRPAVEIFVSPGSVGGNGSFEKPYGTLYEVGQALKYKYKTASSVTVWLRGGDYRQSSTVDITNVMTGTEDCPITFKNYNNEEVRIIGSVALDGSQFNDDLSEDIKARLPEESKNKVLQLNLAKQGITKEQYGDLGYPGMYHYVDNPASTDLFVDGTAMTLARYPNEGYMLIDRVISTGTDPSTGESSAEGNGFTIGYALEHEAHIDRWTTAKDAVLYGFFRWGWADQTLDLSSVDVSANTLTSKRPSYYSVANDTNQRFYAYNLLEEIDMPGEYYIDRETDMLYFYPPEGVDVTQKTLDLTTMTQCFLSLTDTDYITFEGIKFSQNRNFAVALNGNSGGYCNNITFKNCTFSYLGGRNGSSVGFVYGGTNNGFINCLIEHTDGGIDLRGGDKTTLTHGNNYVKNCTFNDYSRWKRMYNPAILNRGTGNIISNNTIHNAPHQAIMFGGAENIIEYNEIYDVLLDATDSGAIYCGADVTDRGNQVRYNFIHDIEDVFSTSMDDIWCHGVYLDDNFCSADIYCNVFKNIEGYGVFIGGGRDNTVDNNVFYNCERGTVYIDQRGEWETGAGEGFASGGKFINQLESPTVMNSVWMREYSQVLAMYDEFTGDNPIEVSWPKNNIVTDNVYISSGEEFYKPLAIQYGTFERNLTYSSNPGFVSMDEFTLTSGAQLKTDNSSFIDIPFDMVGTFLPVVDISFVEAQINAPGNTFHSKGATFDVSKNTGWFEENYTMHLTERCGADTLAPRLITDEELENNITWTYPSVLEVISNRQANSPSAVATKVNLRTVEIRDGSKLYLAYNRNEGAVVPKFTIGAVYISNLGEMYSTDFNFETILRGFTPFLEKTGKTLSDGDALEAGEWTPKILVSNQDAYFRGFYGAALYTKNTQGLLSLQDVVLSPGTPLNEKETQTITFDKSFVVSDNDNSVIKFFVWSWNSTENNTTYIPYMDLVMFEK